MIRKDIVYLGIIIILLGIVAVMTCQSPDVVDSEGEKFKDSVKVLKSQKAEISSRFEAIEKASILRQKSDSSKLAASLREIDRLKRKATTAVSNIPVRVMEENPEIAYALSAKDDVIEKQAVLIDTLQNQLQFERNVREQLTALHYDTDKINAQLQEMADVRIVKLEKDLRKERRKGKLARVLIPIALIGGFLLGNQ